MIRILECRGVRKITSLAVYPLDYHATKEKIVEELVQRGRKYIDLIGVHYRSYKGQAFWKKDGQPEKFHVNIRVVIDAVSCRQMKPNYFNHSSREDLDYDLLWLLSKDRSAGNNHPAYGQGETERKISCSREDLLLCSPTVFGFCLPTKQWGQYFSASLVHVFN